MNPPEPHREEIPSLPDPAICRVRKITPEVFDCLTVNPSACRFVLNFGKCRFCQHPDRDKLAVRLLEIEGTHSDIPSLRAHLARLSFGCPLEGGNPDDCICHELRTKPVAERHRIIATYTDEVCLRIFAGHLKCSSEKRHKLNGQRCGNDGFDR